jgi:hypothetical protein
MRWAARCERFRHVAGLREVQPARRRFADRDAREVATQRIDLRRVFRRGDDVPDVASRDPVAEVVTREEAGRGDQHHAELHRREHDFP